MRTLIMIMVVILAGAFKTPDGTAVQKNGIKGKVLIFLQSKCPCVYNHQETFGSLIRKYSGTLEFAAIFVDKNDDPEDIKDMMNNIGWDIPALVDEKGTYVRKYKPSVSTECMLVSPSGKIIYRGAVDDSPLNMGQVRNFYLESAISDYLENRPVRIDQTEGIGCTITL